MRPMLLDCNLLDRRVGGVLLGFLALVTVMVVGAAEDLEGLRARADGRWTALIAGDFDKAYEFETPAYRKLFSAQQYRARYGDGLRWRQARVVKIERKSPEVAVVMLEINYSFHVSGQGMMEDKGLSTETWLWIDGQWWYRAPEPAFPVENPKS